MKRKLKSQPQVCNQIDVKPEKYEVVKIGGADVEIALIEASKLRLNDKFMQHIPRTWAEHALHNSIRTVIFEKIKDFYRPSIDPSLHSDRISYTKGLNPAVGKSYMWWKNNAKSLCLERNSRLGTTREYTAFLGVLIKSMVNAGWKVEDAWHAVCNNSCGLGNYWSNTQGDKCNFEPTGKRNVCGFYDLANVRKILASDKDQTGVFLASGCYNYSGDAFPIATLIRIEYSPINFNSCVGWIVFEK